MTRRRVHRSYEFDLSVSGYGVDAEYKLTNGTGQALTFDRESAHALLELLAETLDDDLAFGDRVVVDDRGRDGWKLREIEATVMWEKQGSVMVRTANGVLYPIEKGKVQKL